MLSHDKALTSMSVTKADNPLYLREKEMGVGEGGATIGEKEEGLDS